MRKRKKKGCLGFLIGLVVLTTLVVTGAKLFFDKNPFQALDDKVKQVAEVIEGVPYKTIDVKDDEVKGKLYYRQLKTEEEQTVYKELLQGVRQAEKEIYVHSSDIDKIHNIYMKILYDFPELFWCTGKAQTSGYEQWGGGYSVVMAEYQYEGEVLEVKKEEVEQQVQNVITGIDQGASQYDKIKYIYETVIFTTDYSLEAPDNQNIYSVLVNKQSVCAGYARSVQYLLERMNVETYYVTGMVEGDQPHAWNIVTCDGQFYQVDATWGDPIFSEGEYKAELDRQINYDYLMCTNEEIYRTHTPDEPDIVPQCNSMQYNFYLQNGSYYDVFDREAIRLALFDAIDNRKPYVDLKFGTSESYEQAKAEMLNSLMEESAQYLGRQYELREIRYFYQNIDEVYRFSLYWEY